MLLNSDFATHRLSEYVWEEENRVSAMLSFGDMADADMAGAFEIWRIYVTSQFQGKGIGKIRDDVRQIISTLCKYKDVEIIAGAVCIDHVHLSVIIPPKLSILNFMGY